MKTFDSHTSGAGQPASEIADLLEQLRAEQKPRFSTYLLPIVLATAFGVIACSDGRAYAGVYFAALTIAFLLHGISERRTRQQIDLVVDLLGENKKTKDSTSA
jgi:hypothetical protein